MAALLPHQKLKIDEKKTTVMADGHSTAGTSNRGKILSKALKKRGTAFKHTYFLSLSQDKGREIFKAHGVIYIYHDVIDDAGDDPNTESRVFEAAERAMEDLEHLIKKIARFNGNNMLITADHGFLFQQKKVSEEDLQAWEGRGTVDKLHRRYVLGKELGTAEDMKKFSFAQLGLEGAGEAFFPKSVNRLRVKGAGSQFVHGGASLQEITIPVLSVNKKRSSDLKYVEVVLLGSNRKITTNQISVRVYQADVVEAKVLPRELELGFYTREGLLLSEVKRQVFGSEETDTRKREHNLRFGFISEARDYEGKDVYLKMQERVPGTIQKRLYKEIPFRVFISMEPDF